MNEERNLAEFLSDWQESNFILRKKFSVLGKIEGKKAKSIAHNVVTFFCQQANLPIPCADSKNFEKDEARFSETFSEMLKKLFKTKKYGIKWNEIMKSVFNNFPTLWKGYVEEFRKELNKIWSNPYMWLRLYYHCDFSVQQYKQLQLALKHSANANNFQKKPPATIRVFEQEFENIDDACSYDALDKLKKESFQMVFDEIYKKVWLVAPEEPLNKKFAGLFKKSLSIASNSENNETMREGTKKTEQRNSTSTKRIENEAKESRIISEEEEFFEIEDYNEQQTGKAQTKEQENESKKERNQEKILEHNKMEEKDKESTEKKESCAIENEIEGPEIIQHKNTQQEKRDSTEKKESIPMDIVNERPESFEQKEMEEEKNELTEDKGTFPVQIEIEGPQITQYNEKKEEDQITENKKRIYSVTELETETEKKRKKKRRLKVMSHMYAAKNIEKMIRDTCHENSKHFEATDGILKVFITGDGAEKAKFVPKLTKNTNNLFLKILNISPDVELEKRSFIINVQEGAENGIVLRRIYREVFKQLRSLNEMVINGKKLKIERHYGGDYSWLLKLLDKSVGQSDSCGFCSWTKGTDVLADFEKLVWELFEGEMNESNTHLCELHFRIAVVRNFLQKIRDLTLELEEKVREEKEKEVEQEKDAKKKKLLEDQVELQILEVKKRIDDFFFSIDVPIHISSERMSVIGKTFFNLHPHLHDVCTLLRVGHDDETLLKETWNIFSLLAKETLTEAEKKTLHWINVKEVAKQYRERWTTSDFTYLHLLHHLIEQCARFGSCGMFSGQFVEHMNHTFKRAIKLHSNHSREEGIDFKDYMYQAIVHTLTKFEWFWNIFEEKSKNKKDNDFKIFLERKTEEFEAAMKANYEFEDDVLRIVTESEKIEEEKQALQAISAEKEKVEENSEKEKEEKSKKKKRSKKKEENRKDHVNEIDATSHPELQLQAAENKAATDPDDEILEKDINELMKDKNTNPQVNNQTKKKPSSKNSKIGRKIDLNLKSKAKPPLLKEKKAANKEIIREWCKRNTENFQQMKFDIVFLDDDSNINSSAVTWLEEKEKEKEVLQGRIEIILSENHYSTIVYLIQNMEILAFHWDPSRKHKFPEHGFNLNRMKCKQNSPIDSGFFCIGLAYRLKNFLKENKMQEDLDIKEFLVEMDIEEVHINECCKRYHNLENFLQKVKIFIDQDMKKENQMRYFDFEENETKKIMQTFDGEGTDIVCTIGNANIDRETIWRCVPGMWLNDGAIDAYWVLLMQKYPELKKKFFCVGCCFWIKLKNSKNNCLTQFHSTENFLEYEKILIPVNTDNIHWNIAVMNLKDKRFEFYDSCYHDGDREIKKLKDFFLKDISFKSRNKKSNSLFCIPDEKKRIEERINEQLQGRINKKVEEYMAKEFAQDTVGKVVEEKVRAEFNECARVEIEVEVKKEIEEEVENTIADRCKIVSGLEVVLHHSKTDLAHQGNTYDCGAYVCQFMKFICQDLPISATTLFPEMMHDTRKKMILEIINQEIAQNPKSVQQQ